MSKYNNYISNFSRGEVSPLTYGRVLDEGYKSGSRTMLNCYPLKEGRFSKRPGTRFAVDLEYNVAPGLIDFIATDNVGYTVVLDATTPQNPDTMADVFCRVFAADGTECSVSEALYVGSSLFSINSGVDPEGWYYSQIGDLLIITHVSGTIVPMNLVRLSSTTFALTPFFLDNPYKPLSFTHASAKFPYRDRNISSVSLTPSATTGNITLTASSAFFTSGMATLKYFKIVHGTTEGVVRMTGFTSSTVISATVIITLGGTGATTNWAEGAWCGYRGWPRTVCVHQNRTVYGGNDAQPDTLWGSLLGNYWLMDAERLLQDKGATSDVSGRGYFGNASDDDPFIFAIPASTPGSINWLGSANVLKIGTLTREYVGSGADEILGTKSVGFAAQTSHGSRAGRIIQVDDELIYISQNGREVRNFRFSDSNGSNVSEELTLMAGHISSHGRESGDIPGLHSLCYQTDEKFVWAITNGGKLVGLTHQTATNVKGWHRHDIEGADEIVSCCVIPSPNKESTRLWMAVKRTIDNSTKYYLEYLPRRFEGDSLDPAYINVDEDISAYLDSCKVITLGSPSDTLTGLDHLEGEEVYVVKDGFLLDTFTVSGGEIDLGEEYATGTVFVVGYYYEAEQETVDMEAGGDWGASQGMTGRIDRVVVKFHESYGVSIGSGDEFYEALRTAEDVVTQDERVELPNSPSYNQTVTIKSTGPYPMTVLGMAVRGVANE